MILSASRRTDLPALYGPWLLGRLEAGRCSSPSPTGPAMPPGCSFPRRPWTPSFFGRKTPSPFCPCWGGGGPGLPGLSVPVYHHRPGHTLEPGLPPLEERLTAFEKLAQRLGPARVDWRFDPILLDSERTPPGMPGALGRSAAVWPLHHPVRSELCGPLRPQRQPVPGSPSRSDGGGSRPPGGGCC